MSLAPEGIPQMAASTALLGGGAWLLVWLGYWPAAVVLAVVWAWSIAFFRDPHRSAVLAEGELCAPADGRVTEITRLDHDDRIGGPAVRIGIFLSIFNVHINRSPCAGTVRSVEHVPGKFLDARHPDSGRLNESNTLVIEPANPIRGPLVVRQVAGKVARRIVCHASAGSALSAGGRFGMIKFGSRTELILPDDGRVEVAVEIGSKVKAGLTIVAKQLVSIDQEQADAGHRETATVKS